jgi:alkylation response protein AidB-like acyl-CoA dehydrogenase
MTLIDTTAPVRADELVDRITRLGPDLGLGHADRDARAEFGRAQWRELATAGLFRAGLPVEHHGSALSATELIDVAFALGRANRDSGLSFSAATHLASTGVALTKFGSRRLKERYLLDVGAGDVIGSHAISEPGAGSDVLSMTSSGALEGDDLVLNGLKTYVTNGPIADLSIVYVKTSDRGGPLSLTAVLVPRGTAGAEWGPALDKVTMKTSPFGELRLRDCRVGRENIVGGVGMGFVVLDYVMTWEILISFAINVGEMQHRLQRMIARAKDRSQFGAPLATFQGIQNTIVDSHLAVESARLALREAAALLDSGQKSTAATASAKILTSQANVATALAAIELFGASGLLTETGLESGLRDSLGGPIYSGSNAIQRQKIAKALGL